MAFVLLQEKIKLDPRGDHDLVITMEDGSIIRYKLLHSQDVKLTLVKPSNEEESA